MVGNNDAVLMGVRFGEREMSGGGVRMSGERGVERVREESGVVREMSREIERDEVRENEKSGGEREWCPSEMRVESERVEVFRYSIVVGSGEEGGRERV